MSDSNEAERLKARIAELEERLKRVSLERELYKETVNSYLRTLPFTPPTEEELEEMVNGPRGESIREIIEQLEREFGFGDDDGPIVIDRQ